MHLLCSTLEGLLANFLVSDPYIRDPNNAGIQSSILSELHRTWRDFRCNYEGKCFKKSVSTDVLQHCDVIW